jgi:hypothetical protein
MNENISFFRSTYHFPSALADGYKFTSKQKTALAALLDLNGAKAQNVFLCFYKPFAEANGNR